MIAFVLIAGVTGVGLWFLWFVVSAPTRERVPASRRVPYARTRSSTDSVAGRADDADRVAGGAFGDHLPNDPRSHVRQGHLAQVLLKFSVDTHADMLTVGSRGHGGFGGMLLGSTSAYYVEYASCAVLVVHGNSGWDGSPR